MKPNKPFDAILVLGGGVREGGELPPWVRSRLDHALNIWQGEYVVALSAGTPHRPPPLDERGFPIFESEAAARYLLERGLPAARVLLEKSSYDTIGNAYFARVIHAGPRGWRHLAVVTSEFHMERAKAAFEWVFSLEADFELAFFATANDGLAGDALAARQEKERQALEALRARAAAIRTLDALHRWLFSEHEAYAAQPKRRDTAGLLAASY